jgi:hypothetical protein
MSMNMFGYTPRAPTRNSYTAAGVNVLDTNTMSWTAIGGYTVATLIVMLILLLFINYTIYPIFQLQPGGPGFIRIPYMESQEKYWTSLAPPFNDISGNCKINTASMAYNWSMVLDLSIKNPTMNLQDSGNKTLFRLLFNRGGTIIGTPVFRDGSISDVITGHNLAIGLLRDTNDLYVSTTTSVPVPNSNTTTLQEQGLLINNVPTQTPFRIGVTVMSTYMEVYLNGKLSKTLKLAYPIADRDSTMPILSFQAPQGSTLNQIARVGNLLVWNQVISPSVMKYAKPELMEASPEDTLGAAAGSCAASIYDSLNDLTGGQLSNINQRLDTAFSQAATLTTAAAAAAATGVSIPSG